MRKLTLKNPIVFKIILKYYISKASPRPCSVASLCRDYNYSRTLFYYWKNKFDRDELFIQKETRGRKTIITEQLITFIKEILDKDCDITLSEITDCCRLNNFIISVSTTRKIVYDVLKYRYKVKQVVILPEKYNVDEHNESIVEKQKILQNLGIDNVVSIDESAFYKEMATCRGWCKKGCKLKITKSKLRFKRYSLLMAINSKRIIDYILVEGSINATIYKDFITNLIPKINETNLLMDNASIHKTAALKQLLNENNKNPVFTVPYTPDLNPIENTFSIIKHHVRKNKPKTIEDVDDHIKESIRKIKPTSLTKMYRRSFGLTDFKIRK